MFGSIVEQSIRHVSRSSNTIEADACFSPDAPIFQGHFPGRPIVPAVYLVALCRTLLEKYHTGECAQLTRSRFSAACVPDVLYKVKISLEESAGSSVATCSIRQGDVMHSKIVLSYDKQESRG
jgi:3-hydroxymyristoyl/3-hydroxydecanoyl-(acyl carrier protein) dehydratase